MEHSKLHKKVMVLYPEGTRNPKPGLLKFKSGVALFADRLNINVIPAYIDGAKAAMPKGKFFPRKQKIRVYFGKPLQINTTANEQNPITAYPEFIQQIKSSILELEQQALES